MLDEIPAGHKVYINTTLPVSSLQPEEKITGIYPPESGENYLHQCLPPLTALCGGVQRRAAGFMKLGIVGLPNVGKIYSVQRHHQRRRRVANYPFCTIEPNVGMVTVPDERLDWLAEMYSPKKETPPSSNSWISRVW
jgi:hypothetical protein